MPVILPTQVIGPDEPQFQLLGSAPSAVNPFTGAPAVTPAALMSQSLPPGALNSVPGSGAPAPAYAPVRPLPQPTPPAPVQAPPSVPSSFGFEGTPAPAAKPTPANVNAYGADIRAAKQAQSAARAEGEDAYDIAQGALTTQQDAAAGRGKARGDAADAKVKIMQAFDAEETAAEKVKKESLQQSEDAIAKATDDYVNSGKYDFWAKQSTGTQVTAALAMAFGGLGESLKALGGGTPGENPAMRVIDQIIDRDYAEFQAERGRKRENIGFIKEKRQRTIENFGDEKQQRLGHYITALGAVDAQLDKMSSGLESTDAVAKIGAIRADLQSKHAAAQEQYANNALATAVARSAAAANAPLAAEKQRLDLAQKAANVDKTLAEAGKARADAGATASKMEVTLPDGTTYQAKTEKEAQDAREGIRAVSSIRSLVERAKALRDKPSSFVSVGGLKTDSAAELASVQSDLIMELKDAKKLGVIAGPDLSLMMDLLGNPSSLFGSSANLEKFAQRSEQSLARYARAQGDAGAQKSGPNAVQFTPVGKR